MRSKNNLSTKIILMVECILLISSVLFCAVSVYRARVGIRKAIQQRMLDIANCASGSISGDLLRTLDESSVGSPAYNDVYNTLAVFRDNVELEYVYSIKEESPSNFIFTMDLDPVSPASYGDSVEYTEALASAGRGVAAVDEIPYTDQWGEFYSAYSPTFDSDGNVAGIVAVDFSVEWFEDQLSAQTRSTVISYIIILIITLLLAALLSVTIVRPFVRMQGELLEEKVRAESASQAKSDFLANMSHEIRTPINAVLGMNEMIIREEKRAQEELTDTDTKTMRESLKNIGLYAADVKSAGNNLLAIVNDILDFSKIEAGTLDVVEAPYQLSSLLNDINNMIFFKARDKGLAFSIEVDKDLPDELSGDEVRVRQILTNLLVNAVKYTEKGSVRFTMSGEKKDDGTLVLNAEVHDTGIGIKEEDLEKLFTKFQRLEMEHNSTVEGTGLGLVITKRLLDMMNGEISVKSEYGKGSVFSVSIPQRIISDAPMGDFQERFEANLLKSGTYRESFRAPDAHILIVDDTRINLTVAVNLLHNTKLRIDTATNGADAVDMAAKKAYDLILMDQRMPEMNGTEALHAIRGTASGACVNVPVICLTADAVIGARERYLAEGFTDYMTKPIESASLEKMLLKYLPEEKVELVREEVIESPAVSDSVDDGYEALRAVGINPATGLHYCENDDTFYRSLLAEYAHGYAEKTENLKNNYADSNWHEYAIYVHALKSTSRMIGAESLAELAARLEAAGGDGDGDTIHAEHDAMMEKYTAIKDAILSIIPESEDFPDVDDDDEILEFFPEGE